MSAGQINVPIVFRGPNGAAAGVGAQHSQVIAPPALLITFVDWHCHMPSSLFMIYGEWISTINNMFYYPVLCSMVCFRPWPESFGPLFS